MGGFELRNADDPYGVPKYHCQPVREPVVCRVENGWTNCHSTYDDTSDGNSWSPLPIIYDVPKKSRICGDVAARLVKYATVTSTPVGTQPVHELGRVWFA